MRCLAVVGLLLVVGCTKRPEQYCETQSECPNGTCVEHVCTPGPQPDADPNAPDAPPSCSGPSCPDAAPVACDERIAWLKRDGSGYDLYVADVDGSHPMNLTEDTGLINIAPFYAWAPDGSRLIYHGPEGLHLIHPDGTGDVGLTAELGLFVDWSPDSDSVVYVRNDPSAGNRTEIWRRDTDGGTGHQQLSDGGTWDDSAPSWSPDGSRIAYVSDKPGNWEIYVMNSDGSGDSNQTNNSGNDGASGIEPPQWSPSGEQILFVSARTGNADIWVMNADGSEPVNLTQSTVEERHPRWSPDGETILYTVVPATDQTAVYLMNADGTGQHAVADFSTQDTQAEFSPAGNRFVWSTNRITDNGDVEVYTAALDGSAPTRITIDEDNDDTSAMYRPCD